MKREQHTYIAVYSMITPPEERMKFHSAEEFEADSDERAERKADNIALALEAIANNRPENAITKAIVLISITDQNTRRKIYSIGYTVEE